MKTLNQDKHNHSESCIRVKVSRRTQNFEMHLGNGRSGLALFGTDLGHVFGNSLGFDFGVILRAKRPQNSNFAYDIVRIHSLMIYTNLIKDIIVGNTRAPKLRRFLFISKLKAGYFTFTGQHMNHQTFINLQFRPLLKNSLHSFHIVLKGTSGDKIPFCLSVSFVLFWCLDKPPTFISKLKDVTSWLLQDK